MTFDELKNLELKDLAGLPPAAKIAGIAIACLLILGGGYWYVIKGELARLEGVRKEEQTLRQTYLAKKALAINLPAYRAQMEQMQQTFGSLLRQLPNTTEVPDLLVDITQAGLGRGLEFSLFRPEKERPREFYAELPVSLVVTGSYHEMALFISDVAALPRIVTFGNINISSGKGGRLSMQATARTYRYLEAHEMKPPARKGGRRRR